MGKTKTYSVVIHDEDLHAIKEMGWSFCHPLILESGEIISLIIESKEQNEKFEKKKAIADAASAPKQ